MKRDRQAELGVLASGGGDVLIVISMHTQKLTCLKELLPSPWGSDIYCSAARAKGTEWPGPATAPKVSSKAKHHMVSMCLKSLHTWCHSVN